MTPTRRSLLLAGTATFAADWPRWRGPQAENWSQTENVRWSVRLPGWGTSSPVVYRDRLFITTQAPADNRRSFLTLCVGRNTGKEIWHHDFGPGFDQRAHEKSNLAVNTPTATDDAVMLPWDHHKGPCYLIGLDNETGKIV